MPLLRHIRCMLSFSRLHAFPGQTDTTIVFRRRFTIEPCPCVQLICRIIWIWNLQLLATKNNVDKLWLKRGNFIANYPGPKTKKMMHAWHFCCFWFASQTFKGFACFDFALNWPFNLRFNIYYFLSIPLTTNHCGSIDKTWRPTTKRAWV